LSLIAAFRVPLDLATRSTLGKNPRENPEPIFQFT
jgi:hypothetical protein